LLSFLQDNSAKNTIHIQDVMSQWAGNLFFIFYCNSELSVCNCSYKNHSKPNCHKLLVKRRNKGKKICMGSCLTNQYNNCINSDFKPS
jgi:hypothetical protein